MCSIQAGNANFIMFLSCKMNDKHIQSMTHNKLSFYENTFRIFYFQHTF